MLVKHAETEEREGRNMDYAVPKEQSEFEEKDRLCGLMGREFDW